jgi:PAS domain S-box-containing protein
MTKKNPSEIPNSGRNPKRTTARQHMAVLERENSELKKRIAELQQVEESLGSERDKLQALVDGLARTEVGIDIIGTDHRIHFQNDILEQRFGPLEGEPCYEKYMGLDHPCQDCPMTAAIDGNTLEVRELSGEDGRILRILSAPFSNPDGSVDRVVEVIIDITERKRTEELLRESEQMFRSIVENSHGGIFVVDQAYRFTYANERLAATLGYPHDEIIGHDFREFLDEESRQLVAERYVRRQRGEEVPSRYEFNVIQKDGTKRRVELSSAVIRDPKGKLRTVGQILDITERQKTEEELRESERKFSGIAQNIPGVVYQMRVRQDSTSYFSYVSPRAAELFALPTDPSSPEWNLGVAGRVCPDDREPFLLSIGQAIATRSNWNFEGRMMMPGGGTKWFQGISSPMGIGDELVFDGLLLDITERKKAEEELQQAHADLETRVEHRTLELREANDLLQQEILQRKQAEKRLRASEFRYRELVESANSIVLEMDTEGKITFFNKFAQEFFGFSEAEILGQNVIGTIVPPTDSAGNDLSVKIEDLVRRPEHYQNSENENMRRNGDRVWIAWTNKGIFDAEGRLSEILCTGIDRTEQKRTAETLAIQAQERVAAAERQRLARDLHDAVTQTLFSASLIAEVLPKLWEKDPNEGRRRLEELRQLTRGALAEMRMLLLELRPAALTEAGLADLLRQLTEAATARARLPVNLTCEGPCNVPPDAQIALYRVAQEALNNVVKHSGATEASVRLHCQADLTELTISDNGSGFDVDAVSAKHLGLRIMRERAEAAGADLEIKSTAGHGTKIVINWPGHGKGAGQDG